MSKDNTSSISKLLSHLKTPQTKFIFLTGAGISTSAGIPDFRSPETGLYHNLQKLRLPYAEAVFDIDYFAKNPKPFLVLSKELYPGQFIPTAFHFFMKLLEKKGKLARIYTQNIDTMERITGIDGGFIVEAHGSFEGNHCIDCHEEFDGLKFKEMVFQDEEPRCLKCKGLVKPDITFFGESLPPRFFSTWDEDVEKLSKAKSEDFVVITAGTSLTVYPFASLPAEVPKKVPRMLINMDIVGDFKENQRKSDLVVVDEEIDVYISKVIEEIGWMEEYKQLRADVVKKLGIKEKDVETAEEKLDEITKDIEEELENEEKTQAQDDEGQLEELSIAVKTLEIQESVITSYSKDQENTSSKETTN